MSGQRLIAYLQLWGSDPGLLMCYTLLWPRYRDCLMQSYTDSQNLCLLTSNRICQINAALNGIIKFWRRYLKKNRSRTILIKIYWSQIRKDVYRILLPGLSMMSMRTNRRILRWRDCKVRLYIVIRISENSGYIYKYIWARSFNYNFTICILVFLNKKI